jgi:hypothetical protein
MMGSEFHVNVHASAAPPAASASAVVAAAQVLPSTLLSTDAVTQSIHDDHTFGSAALSDFHLLVSLIRARARTHRAVSPMTPT